MRTFERSSSRCTNQRRMETTTHLNAHFTYSIYLLICPLTLLHLTYLTYSLPYYSYLPTSTFYSPTYSILPHLLTLLTLPTYLNFTYLLNFTLTYLILLTSLTYSTHLSTYSLTYSTHLLHYHLLHSNTFNLLNGHGFTLTYLPNLLTTYLLTTLILLT
jgi:hypothetical protein